MSEYTDEELYAGLMKSVEMGDCFMFNPEEHAKFECIEVTDSKIEEHLNLYADVYRVDSRKARSNSEKNHCVTCAVADATPTLIAIQSLANQFGELAFEHFLALVGADFIPAGSFLN